MSRATWMLDRVAAIIVGVALIAAGALAFIWRLGVWSYLPERTDTAAVTDPLNTDWWPYAVAGAGAILVLVGVRWLWAHLPGRGVGELNLPGTGDPGRLRFNAKAAASTAADVFAAQPAVRSAKGTVKRDRGQLVVDLKATVEPDADIAELAEDADQIIADLARVMGRHDLYGRVHLVVSSSAGSSNLPRVV